MEANERLNFQAQLLDITHEAIIALDADERIIYWNRGAERTYGWSEHEALGKPLHELLRPDPEDWNRRGRAERMNVLRSGETLSGEYGVRRKDEGGIDVEYNARALFDARGNLDGYVTVHRDVTARRRSERALREREARLQALIEASPLGIDIMDREGRPIFYNPKCVELHGIGLGEAFGDGWEQAVHPEDRERIALSWYAAARDGRSWHEIYRFRHRDGRIVWVSGRAAPIRVEDHLVGFVGTLEDVSAERKARERAERATRIRDRMLAAVTHDLRNPLNTIGLILKALAADGADSRYGRELKVLERSAETMNRLVRDLLDVSHFEAGFARIERKRIDVGGLCRESLEAFEAEARERGIELACDIEPGLPAIEGDPHRLAQVLSNLLGNSLKFTPGAGRVRVRSELAEGTVRISVEDTGPGIAQDDIPHLFEPSWQGRRGSGSGLGLSICRAIVEAHDGRIWIESRPGEGTAVRFTLP